MRARTLPQLAAQLVNLLNLCLLHGASLFSSPDDLAELHTAVAREADTLRCMADVVVANDEREAGCGLRMVNIEVLQRHYGLTAGPVSWEVLHRTVRERLPSITLRSLDRLDAHFALGTAGSASVRILDTAAVVSVERTLAAAFVPGDANHVPGIAVAREGLA